MGFKELERDCKVGKDWKLKCPVCQSSYLEISEFPEFEKLLCTCGKCGVDFILYPKSYKKIE